VIHLTAKRDYLLRIIAILKGLGKGNQTILNPIFNKIKEHIFAAEITKESFSVALIIEAMHGLAAEPSAYAGLIDLLKNVKDELLYLKKFDGYRHCCQALAKLVPDNAAIYVVNIAEAYTAEGDQLLEHPTISQHLVANKY